MKKNWKRILSMFLAFVMVFGMLPVNAFADETEPVILEDTSATEPVTAEVAETAAVAVEETTAPVTEAPEVETTVPVTEAPEEETTVPVTEAPEVETTVPATEAPAEEPKTAKDKVSDSAANEAAEPEVTEAEVTEPETGIRKGPAISCAPSRIPADDDALFAGYADHIWFGTDIAFFGTSGREQLDEDTRILYDALVPLLKQIASGERTSGLIKVGTTLDPTDPEYVADVEVSVNTYDFDLAGLLDALLADMPYELYWYDKTAGTTYYPATDYDEVYFLHYFYFSVAGQYNDGSYDIFEYDDGTEENVYYTADPGKISAVQDTAAAAQAVVDSVAADPDVKTDYDKLLAYKDWICENTSYNEDVKSGDITFSENIDPWQVIYVFDGLADTTVVCEGYSKAFQYLCDLSDFTTDAEGDENVTCYSVTGTLVGIGDHMWNIVDIEGSHYLADITNCDEDTVGDDGSLFLVGGTPDSTGVYTFDTKGTSTAGFAYDADTKSLWGDSGILTLAENNYEPPVEEEPEVPDESEPSDEMTQAEFAAELAANAGTNYILNNSVTITEDMTIRMATEEVPYNHSVLVNTGATLTVASGATLTMETNLMVGGGTIIVEEGGCLAIGSSEETRGMLYVWGGTLDVAAESGLDLSYGRLTVQYGSDYEIPGWITEDSINAQAYIREPEQLQEMLALTQYAFIDIYVQCDLAVTEDITIAGNQFLGLQPPYTMTVNEGVTVTVESSGVLFCSDSAVLNNNGRILCYGQFQNYGTLNGNAVEIVRQEMDEATFLEEMAGSGGFYRLVNNLTITGNVEIPAGQVVYVDDNTTMTVAEGATVTVNGQLSTNNGSIIVNGTLINNGWMHIDSISNTGSITIGSAGTCQNNAGLFIGSGTLTIDGTYTPGENGYVQLDDTKAVINGIEKIGERIQLQIITGTEEELIAALEKREGFAYQHVYTDEDIVLNSDLTVPEGVFLILSYSNGNGSDYKTLTIPEGVTLTVDGQLGISGRGELVLDPGSRLVNNGSVHVSGRLVNNGTIEGNDVEIYGNGTIVSSEMSQADFEAAVAAAAENGETYELNRPVTLTEDLVIASNVNINPSGSLTVADGAELTIRNTYDNEFAQLIVTGGTMTVQSGATLTIESMMQVAGTLTVEAGATVNAGDDSIWLNVTDGGVINGIDSSRLGATYGVETAEEIEAAYNDTDTYAAIHVYIDKNITLNRNITIPEGDTLNQMQQSIVKVPAGYTLTNNGAIYLEVENRLEVLVGAELVNNGIINVSDYSQLVIRGTLSGEGTVNGTIVWGEMSHEELIAALQQCALNGSGWVHESETTLETTVNEGVLKISMGGGDPAPEFYLVEGGVLRVPSGTRLEVYNPLIVLEGGKVIVEEGGTLYVDGTLSVEGGTVYIEEGGTFEPTSWDHVQGEITWEGNTATYLSETWLDNRDEGWYWPEENIPHEAHGLHVMDCHWRIFFLNTWDAENLQWNRVPVIPTEVSEYMTITRIMDMEDQFIRGDQEYAEYYVCVDVFGTLEGQNVNLFVDGTAYPYELFQRTVAFYSEPTVSMDTLINNGHHSMNGETEEEAVYWLVKEPEYFDVLNFSWDLETWGEDYTQYTGGDPLVTLDETQAEQGIYKFVIDPDYVEYTKFNWKNFNLQIHMELDDNRDGENNINIEYWDRDIWIDPAPQAQPQAHLRINNQTYLVFENDIIYRDFFTGEYDEWGNEIWGREQCSLPEGVSYVLEDNKLILDNAHLERLELAYMDCWEDDEGYHEEHRLPSENLSLVVYGESSIMNGSECAMIIRNGTNVNISGTGSLHLYAENSPDNINEEGNRYAYPTVRINDGSSLTIGGNVEVTAEIAGSGFHGDMPAQMSAIDGYSEDPAFGNALTISGNAVLNIATPEGARTLDESQENYGGTRGIVSISIEVNDNATLNTGSIYLWDGVDFTMNGGTVNLDPIGEIFYHPRLEDYYISRLGIYLEESDSVFTLNDGIINIHAEPDEADYYNFCRTTFQGINAPIGDIYINGGEINIYGNGNDGGSGIAVQCAWDENGNPVEGLPTGNLYLSGGTVNIYDYAASQYEGIYVSALSDADFSGGVVYTDHGVHYFEGSVDWTGNTELTGNAYILDGAELVVKNGATLTVDDFFTVEEGGRIIVEDGGNLYVRGILNIEGTVYMRSGASLSTDPGHQINGKITWEGDTAPYLTATWLDNYDNEGWYMNDEFFEENGLMSMEEHWRIFFLNTWDAENLIWNSVPVIPTENSEFMTITRVMDMEDQHIREDQDPAYSNYFVRVEVYGTLDRQDVTLSANGYSIPFEIHERHTGFFRTAEFTLDSIIQGHDFVLDPTAEENSIYWLVRDTENYDIVYEEFNYRTWNDEDYSDYITGEDLIVLDDSRKDEGIYKITVDPGFVDYVQYDFKNFEIRVNMTLDHNGDDEIYEEPNNGGMWIQPPELKDPAAALNIDNAEYMIFDTGRIFRDVFGGYDEWGNQIWRRQETSLPKGVSYVLENNQLILDNANLTSLNLHPTVSGYDEEGNFWVAFGLPNENLTITLVGSSTIENHCNAALWFNDGTNATITGNGQLYAKTTNYPDYLDENGELWCSNTINVHNGSSLTIGGNATVTAELSGHGYWDNGEGATCHPISGTYEGEALEITGNATVTTVVPNGVRRYDESGSTSQIGGYVGIQNFNSITVSGGTLNTDHLNFYDGGEFNMTGGVANFRDIGGVNLHPETGEPIYHYEAINMRNGSVNISGGELNIDVTAREGETIDNAGFYGINAVNGTIDISGGTINITGSTDGWAIIADTEYDDNGPIDGTGSTLSITGGTINVNVPGKIYHGGVVVSDFCEGYFAGGEINDDYGIHRFFGETLWEGTVLNGIAANVYTHGPGSFHMSDGQINLTGDSYEENGETIRNRAIFQPNAGGSIYGGQINLTNGTYINNMNLAVDGGEITIENDWPDVPGLENNLYFATTGGTMDITANGTAIVSNGTFHQMGGEITAVNTSDSMPVMVSSGQTLQNTGTLNLRGGNIGMVQAYNFDQAGTENESMLFVGDVSGAPAPELNISDTKIGLYLNGPAFITGGADVNIQVAGEPINEDRQWPMAIYVEKHTGNPDLSGDNVSGLVITGGANVNLVSEDTAGVDAMSKGIVAWYSPVAIRGTDETDVPKVTIDAEMAVYSVSNALEDTNFNENITFFDQSGAEVSLTSRDFTETEETGDFLHTLMDGDSYVGYATIGKSSVMSLDEFLAAVAEAAAYNEYYMLTRNVVIDRDVELNSGIMIGNGAELIVKNGAVLTNNMEIQVWKNGKLTVEAGGRLDNRGALNAEGTIHISDDGDYAGYVHNTEQFKVGIYAYGTDIPSITGIPEEVSILQAQCETEDQVNYILSICGGYFETLIRLTEDMVLHTMTIPENVWLNTLPDLTITVADGAFLTVNGGLNTRNSDLVVNGKLISNSEMTFNLSEVTINGTFDSKAPLFINDGSVMTVNGTLNSYAPLHVGFWRDAETEGLAGTLNINGMLNNYDYLNICPDFYIEEDNRYCGGIVNVNEGGKLDNTFDADAKVSGFVDLAGTLNVHGTMRNGQLTEVRGSLHLYGKLDNGGTIRLYDLVQPELVTYEGAELINNTMIGNFSTNGVITLAEGTYTQGSHTYQDGTTELGELDARYFDDQTMAKIEGAPNGMVSIFYEGSNAEALLAASEHYNWNKASYDRCFLRVVDDMTFSAGKELNLAPGTYLVVLNNGDNYNGSLTVEGAIFNQSYIRLFGADMTIPEGGWITNKGAIETGMMMSEKPTVTVGGLLENASTGIVEMTAAEFILAESGVMQNNLADSNLGTVNGIPVSQQTLFTDITEGTQEQLQEVIGIVQNDGYHGGHFWISEDMHITSSMVIPGGIGISVQNGATLTVDYGVILQLDGSINVDAGGELVINGTLGVGGIVDVRGTMTVYGNVGTGSEAVINIFESGVLNVYEWFGVDSGTLNVYGTLNNNGSLSVTWTEERTGSISGNINPSEVSVWMPFNDRFPNHDEEDIAAMMAFTEQNGYGSMTVQFTIDYTFTDSFTVPEGMTFEIGSYNGEDAYRAATVTIPAGVTLTVDGNLEVAQKSTLIIEEGAELILRSREFYAYGSLINNGTILVDEGYPYIDGTYYQHGENAKILLESYDEDYAEIYGIDRELVTLVFRGNDEQQLLYFFQEMKYGGYCYGDAYIEGTMSMYNNWYVEPYDWEAVENFDVDVYVSGENSVLNVPETYDTHNVNTSIYVENGGRVNVTGALFIHADMLIMDGGTVTVDGTMSSGTVYVYEGGKLIVNGNWDGYNPINYGGTIEGECFRLTQDKLELLMAQAIADGNGQVIMRSSLELERDMTIDGNLAIPGEGYVLTVPAGTTLTVNGYLQLNLGAKLDIQGTLVCNGTVIVSGEGTELVNNGTVNNNGSIHELMNGKIVNNGTWNEALGGSCGEAATWTLENGILTISGSGDMLDYAENSAPWDAYAAEITEVKIGSGITYLGENVFRNIHVDTILVPRTVEGIYTNAFADDVTLKGYHNSTADTYAYYYGNAITYIHELDPDTGKCLYCDFALDSALNDAVTPEEKLDVLKDTDTDTLKDQIEAEMDGGSSDTMDLIEDLDAQAKDNSGITVDATVEAGTNEIITSAFQKVTDEAIVGAALNAEEGVSEVKLVIGNPSGDNEVGEDYNTETGVLFSMTLEGVTDASNLDIPVKITLPVPANISDLSKLVVLHYHNGEEEALKYTLSTGADGKAYVSFVVAGFSDFAIVEEAAQEPVIEKINLSGTAMTLGNSLSMDFGINVANLADNGAGHYAIITKHYADGRTDVVTRVDREDWAVYSGTVYTASCTGIAAKEMCDEVEIVVYNADGYAVSNAYTDSVKAYAMRTLNNSSNQSRTELLTTIVDMLNYGAAAQQVFGYDTGNLANADLTEAQRAMATTEINPSDSRVTGPGYAGSTLTLESQILLDFVFFDSAIGTDYTGMYAIATYTDHYGNAKEVRLEEFKVYASGYHYVSVSGMAVADCSQVVSCAVYNSNGEQIASASDSVEGYIARQLASGRTDAIYTAILKFAASAYNYFH